MKQFSSVNEVEKDIGKHREDIQNILEEIRQKLGGIKAARAMDVLKMPALIIYAALAPHEA